MDDKNLGNKLKEARIAAGKSVTEISAHLTSLGHKASEKTIYSWESGRSQPTPSALLDTCKFYGITDILTALGYKKPSSLVCREVPLSDEEIQIVQDYRNLDVHGKSIVKVVITEEKRRMNEVVTASVSKSANKLIYIPEPLQSASAGTGEFSDDDIAEQVAVLYNKYTSKADYIMRVHGNSMEPQIFDGDRVLVRSQPAVDLGETGIFILNGDRYVKIYRGSYLESANPTYANVPVCEDGRCIGKVISVLNPEWVVEK